MEAPGSYTAGGALLAMAGIFQGLWALVLGLITVWVLVGALFLALAPLGYMQYRVGLRAMGGEAVPDLNLTALGGTVLAVLSLNPLSFVLSTLSLLLLSGPGVRHWIEQDI